MVEKGFVKLPRDIAKRRWFGEANTMKLYVVLLLNAAFKDFERDGMVVRKGQFVTSRYNLANMCQLTIQQTRTAISHLKATGDITVETTSKFSIITLNSEPDSAQLNPPINPQANRQVNQPINHRSRSSKDEVKEETKEEVREAAAPASHSSGGDNCEFSVTSEDERSRLVEMYGSDKVAIYEEKLRKWTASHGISTLPLYSTIAKWLAPDATAPIRPATPPAADRASAIQSPRTPKRGSIDVERLMQQVKGNYARSKGGG